MNFSDLWEPLAKLFDDLAASVPRVVLAVILILVAVLAGRLVRNAAQRFAARRQGWGSLQIAFGRLAMATAVLFGLLLAATVVFPNFTPSDLIGTLGLGGVAIGFAFRDIFQNFLAGILLLTTRPFHRGDQIRIGDFEGQVEEIQTRATFLKTYDGRRVIIPNAQLFMSSVIVNTAFTQRRMEYDIPIGYDCDIEQARAIVLDVMEQTDGVAPDPKADVIVVELADSSIKLRARWWSDSRIADVLVAQDKVLSTVRRRFRDARIDIPYPTRDVYLHDMTSADVRSRRRDGPPEATA